MIQKAFVFFFLCFALNASAQSTNPVKWTFDVVESADGHSLKAKAVIDKNWVVYSPFTDEGGPVATTISIEDVELRGEVEEEGMLIKEYSDLFEIDVAKFKNEVTFIQHFKRDSKQDKVQGYVRFMTCDGERCLAPKKIPFSISLN